ncbi:hypothetical protein J2Z76_001120 [Sedimentibacter acidaminivorans]|uniref:Uncharacterized protein n=1 Tax=Sedimentibacter acidaminivorans TaxID=913099 RepID=A0ABS4GC48_9FIRM|nr:hypothetical protein [Sedimentibacter acidaminivorans]MBP1925263.1 hypothetical protein [Sedimentibacter acidaminivorans]
MYRNEIDNTMFNLLFSDIRVLESTNLKTGRYTDSQMVQLIIRIIEKYSKEDYNEFYAAEDEKFYEV